MTSTICDYLRSAVPQGRKGDGSRLYACPRCKGRKKLEVDAHNQVWFCHKCGTGGKLGNHNQLVRSGVITDEPQAQTHLYLPAAEGSPQWIYLQRFRNLSSKVIREDLHPCTGPSMFRVYLPCYDLGSSEPCYFIGRAIFEGFERYQCPPLEDFPRRKTQVLWGLHRVRGTLPQVVVCEGIFDAVWEKNRVAILGKSISDYQVDILRRICTEEIIIMLDGEASEEATQAAKRISKRWAGRVSMARLPIDLDPDRAGKEVCARAIRNREVLA